MGSVRDITCERDLRNVTFSELFYEIAESGDGEELAQAIAEAIEPGFTVEEVGETIEAQEQLPILRDVASILAGRRGERERERRCREPEIDLGEIAEIDIEVYNLDCDVDDYLVDFGGELGKPDYAKLVEVFDDRGPGALLDWLSLRDGEPEGFLDYLDTRICAAAGRKPRRYLAALVLLPRVLDDHDMCCTSGASSTRPSPASTRTPGWCARTSTSSTSGGWPSTSCLCVA